MHTCEFDSFFVSLQAGVGDGWGRRQNQRDYVQTQTHKHVVSWLYCHKHEGSGQICWWTDDNERGDRGREREREREREVWGVWIEWEWENTGRKFGQESNWPVRYVSQIRGQPLAKTSECTNARTKNHSLNIKRIKYLRSYIQLLGYRTPNNF